MSLRRVRVEAFRCLEQVELELHPQRSYLFGPNGAGKTSLLEAVYLIGRGRSFRTRQMRRLLSHGSSAFSVYGEVTDGGAVRRLGVGWGGSGLDVRVDGERAGSLLELSRIFPVQVVDPGLHEVIDGPPATRRRFMDWGVFHVEPDYLDAWRRYRRLLGQRNAALKTGGRGATLDSWTGLLADAGQAVADARARYIARLAPEVHGIGQVLVRGALEIDYRRGWKEGSTLAQALADSADAERRLGATQVGPHRADLSVRLDATAVRESASRGQQKLIAASLLTGQVRLAAESAGARITLLVDDPAAELDRDALGRLLDVLRTLDAQLILTALGPAHLAADDGFPVFHVERGRITPVVQ